MLLSPVARDAAASRFEIVRRAYKPGQGARVTLGGRADAQLFALRAAKGQADAAASSGRDGSGGGGADTAVAAAAAAAAEDEEEEEGAGARGRESTLVGRDTEAARLLTLIKFAQQGSGRTVLLTGGAGLGKSALVPVQPQTSRLGLCGAHS